MPHPHTHTNLEELAQCDVGEGLVCSIPAAAQESGVHVLLHLPAQSALGACVYHKVSGTGLVQLRVEHMRQ